VIKKCQIEERLAVAIHNYVRSCREVRTAELVDGPESPAALLSARLLKAERRKILGGIESTFHKLGGDAGELQARLDAILIPGGARPEVSEFVKRFGEHLRKSASEELGVPLSVLEAPLSPAYLDSLRAEVAANMTPGPERDTVAPEVDECDLS
jgi:hypothetical protein